MGLAAALGVGLVLLAAGSAHASELERITSYDIVLAPRPDGTMRVHETIVYDFGANDRHGIIRDIPVREPYDDTRDRVYRITDIKVTSPSGAPSDLEESRNGPMLSLRVGHPDKTVSGPQTYVFDYLVHGGLNEFPDHVELYWDAVGDGWTVPIDRATAVVETPGEITKVTCFSGATGSDTPCQDGIFQGNRATFTQTSIPPHSALTVVVAVPTGQITVPPVELATRGDYSTPLFGSKDADIGVAAGLTLLAAVLVFFRWLRTGRDREYVGQLHGLTPASGQPVTVRGRALFGRPAAIAPEFTPPGGFQPGLVGTLIDEKADTIDVTATLIDLAVRGYLRIEEVPKKRRFGKDDWRLVRLSQQADGLLPYEAALFDRLFRGGDKVLLSDLREKFAEHLTKVRKELYAEVVRQGWYRRSPERTRRYWLLAGLLVVAIGLAVGIQPIIDDGQYAFAGIVGVGAVIMVASRAMPGRTADGSAMLTRLLGFRRYISTAEADQIRFEEREQVFSRYLPYAIVFRETEQWTRRFAPIWDKDGSTGPTWYASSEGGFDPGRFGSRMADFTQTTAGAMAAQASSGGSGFSGGGSGGGGGGGGGSSW